MYWIRRRPISRESSYIIHRALKPSSLARKQNFDGLYPSCLFILSQRKASHDNYNRKEAGEKFIQGRAC